MTDYPGFYPDGEVLNRQDTIKYMKDDLGVDTILLSFSAGKDSVALWLELMDHFEIIPFYLYRIPDISFVEETLDYYERWFDQEIVRLPHPTFYRMLANFSYQTPERVAKIRAMNLHVFDYDDINEILGRVYELPDPWCATGIRAPDNMMRRTAIKQRGSINAKRRYFYPIWDMYMDELVELLKRHQIKLSVDYELFGRSYDGMDYRFLKPIHDHYPADWERILEWFPLAEMELLRYES